MKKNSKSFSIILVLVLSLSILISGCSPKKDNTMDQGMQNTKEGLDAKQENDLTGDRNIVKDMDNIVDPDDSGMRDDNEIRNDNLNDAKFEDENIDDNSMTHRSKAISNKVSEIDGINGANVIITGSTALVGIDIPKDTKSDKTTELKDSVQSMVKNSDNKIEKVVVTEDVDLTERIKNIGRDVENGKPISGFGEEIKEIIKRITPNM